MKLSMGPLAQGAAGTTLVGGSVTSGTLYHQEKTAHKDLIRDITARQKTTITDDKTQKTLKCTYWYENEWQKLKKPPKEYSKLTEREKLLGCERFWTNIIKASFKAYNSMIQTLSRQEKRLYKCLEAKKTDGKTYDHCNEWMWDEIKKSTTKS